jgi:hypothetical protein
MFNKLNVSKIKNKTDEYYKNLFEKLIRVAFKNITGKDLSKLEIEDYEFTKLKDNDISRIIDLKWDLKFSGKIII